MSATPRRVCAKDIMTTIPKLSLEIDIDDIDKGVKQLLQVIRPEWVSKKIEFKVFTDGISNRLYGVYLEEDEIRENLLLVRLYGHNTELLIDRPTELCCMQLFHKLHLAPPIYATFNNGMCYGYVPGECLDANNVRDLHIGSLIACEMVRFHAVPLKEIFAGDDSSCPVVFSLVRRWLSLLPHSLPHIDKNKRYQSLVPKNAVLLDEINLLERHLQALNLPVVMCHNDLLLKNIVYNKDKDSVHFIDFEYAGPNYEVFDIANHFAEYAGVDDFDCSRFPGRDHQLKWLRTFLKHKRRLEGGEVTDHDVELLYVQVNKCTLVAHLMWGVWALMQTVNSALDFDFLDYAIKRIGAYFDWKDEFLALEVPQKNIK